MGEVKPRLSRKDEEASGIRGADDPRLQRLRLHHLKSPVVNPATASESGRPASGSGPGETMRMMPATHSRHSSSFILRLLGIYRED